MPPRQRTTFKNKKPTTTYSYVEDRPTSASERLDTFVRSNPQGDNRNTQQASVNQVVLDMPTKFQGKFKGVKNYGDMNSAQKMIFDFYDNRNKYQRDMNNLRTSSPEMRQAYAERFPVENFAMRMGPTIAGAMTGVPLGLLERGFDASKRGFDFAKSGVGKGLDAILSGIDKGMTVADDALYNVANAIEYDTPIGALASGDLKDDAIDIFQEAIAKREEPSTFTVQNRPGGGANDSPLANFGNFRDDFNRFLADVPQQDIKKLDVINESMSTPTGDYFDTRKGFGTRMPGVPVIGDGAFNTMNQVDPNNQFDVAELTQKQIDFMRRPEQSLDFQSRDSLFNKVKQLEDKGFLGFGAQEPTTREEFEQFINSGGIARAANGGMMEKGIASLNNPEYQRLMGASNFGF